MRPNTRCEFLYYFCRTRLIRSLYTSIQNKTV